MNKTKTWKAVTLFSLTMLQLSSVIVPGSGNVFASEIEPETQMNYSSDSKDDMNNEVISDSSIAPGDSEETKNNEKPLKETEASDLEDSKNQSNEEADIDELEKPEEPTSESEDSSKEEETEADSEEVASDESDSEEVVAEEESDTPDEEKDSAEKEEVELPADQDKKIKSSLAAVYKEVNLIGTIYKGGNTIDTLPWGNPGFKTIGHTRDYIGTTVQITKLSNNGAYAFVNIEGLGNGWIDLKAIRTLDVVAVDFQDYISEGKYEVDSLPWGEAGFQKLGKSSQFLGRKMQVRYKTSNNAYYYVEKDGKAIGWIDSKAFGLAGKEYTAIISDGKYEVDTLPWGAPGYKKIGLAKEYSGLELTVKGSIQSGNYLLVYLDGAELGWMDKRALSPFETRSVQYNAYIAAENYEINTLPWGTSGFQKIGKTNILLGNYVEVTRESSNGAYAYVVLNGKGQGWIDKRAFKLKGDSYPAIIQKGKFHVDTLPWGTPGYQKIADTSKYMGQELEVKGTTHAGNYALVYQNGKFLGWIDVKALKPLNYSTVNYTERISGGQYEIDTLPWGEIGYKKLGTTSSYQGLTLTITKVSSNGAYVYASLDGKALGWIDKKAFGFEKLSYSYYVTNGSYNVDTLPWGTIGYKTTGLTSALVGKNLEVIACTQNGAYLQVAENGKVIGWIDSKSGKKLNESTVNYTATVTQGGYNVDSLPWGTHGFKKLADTSSYIGKSVTVTKESENKAYVYALLNGSPLGWIDKRALKSQYTVFIDPGHGGADGGATYFGIKEKDLNLQVSLKLQKKLEALGYHVIMSRTTDVYVDHKTQRSIMANKSGADIFISMHHNAMPSSSAAHGIETYFYEYDPDWPSAVNQEMHNDPARIKESAALANAVQNSLILNTGAFNRKVQTETFAVLRETAIPAILVELGFMSNPTESQKLTTESYQNILAQAVTNGITAYFNSK